MAPGVSPGLGGATAWLAGQLVSRTVSDPPAMTPYPRSLGPDTAVGSGDGDVTVSMS